MPWNLSQMDGQWCVVKQGESSPVPGGCHATRAEAIKHQRALYANESRMASVYTDLDANTPDYVPAPPPAPAVSPELKIVVSQESALTASVAGMLETMAGRMDNEKQQTAALVAALQGLAERETKPPTVNVEAPQITVEAAPTPEVHVAAPNVTVEAAAAPNVTVEAAQVTVRPEIVLPSDHKSVVFERDRAGRITGATVEERTE